MSRNSIIAAVVIVIIALGAWYWAATTPGMQGGPEASTTPQSASSTTSGAGTAGTSSGTTLGAVLSQGGNYTCTIESITSDQHSVGTVFGSGGKTRLDLSVQSNGTTVMTHIIRSGGYSYTWVDGQTTGIKASASTATGSQQPGQGGYIEVNDQSNVSSTCHAWSPDQTQFTPPAGITFIAN